MRQEGAHTAEMSEPGDEVAAATAAPAAPAADEVAVTAEAKRLTDIREKVEYKLSRLKPDRITASHVPASRNKLDVILDLSEE